MIDKEKNTMQYPNDLAPLHDLDNWKVADGEVDPRGLTLIGRGNQELGTIETLLASPTTRKAHFAIVNPHGSGDKFAVPLTDVRFDMNNKRAYAPIAMANFTDAPVYNAGAADYDTYDTYWTQAVAAEPVAATDRYDQHRTADDVIQLREEELNVSKDTVQAGEVAVGKHVVSEEKSVTVPVEHEEVVVTRHAVDRPADPSQIGADSETVKVPVMAEQVSTNVTARVVEEVEVGKRTIQESTTVTDTVRKEKLDLDADGNVNVKDS